MRHAWSLLQPGGTLFVVNQGEEEAAAQGRLFQDQHIPAQSLGEVTSIFSTYRRLRVGWRVTKPSAP